MNNAAAIGYALIAGRIMGMNENQLMVLEGEMVAAMDEHTEEEAEEAYNKN